jgi:hypothetical protein
MNKYERTKLKPFFLEVSDVFNTSMGSVVKLFRVAESIDDNTLLSHPKKKQRRRQVAH